MAGQAQRLRPESWNLRGLAVTLALSVAGPETQVGVTT